ncbi:MAG: Rid family hydrolase [Pseudomonadota bacterium]
MKKMLHLLSLLTLALLVNGVNAQTSVKRYGSEKSIIANAIWVGDTLYLSGQLPSPIAGDTKTQTISTLNVIDGILKEHALGMGDIIQMRVYLVGDAAQGGKLDFAGMNEAYKQFFGTKEQPNKPVRATIQAAALVVPNALVEIEVVAVRSK